MKAVPALLWNFCEDEHPLCKTKIEIKDETGVRAVPVDGVVVSVIVGRTVVVSKCEAGHQAMLLNINAFHGFDHAGIITSTPLMDSAENAAKCLVMRIVDMVGVGFDRAHPIRHARGNPNLH